MYVNTKKVLDELCKANPMMSKEEMIHFVIRKTQKNNKSSVNREKWGSGAYILLYPQGYEALKQMFEQFPTIDTDGMFCKTLPEGAMIAAQLDDGVKVASQDEYFAGRRKGIQTRMRQSPIEEAASKKKIVEILAEIATLQHSIGLKLDNIARLIDKNGSRFEELTEALNGIRRVRHDS